MPMLSPDKIKSFNDLEMSVYHYVVKNKTKIAYMKIRELADETHVSTTTILRFCKKLDCSGFSEFKLKFKLYLEEEDAKKLDMDEQIIIDFIKRTKTKVFQDSLDQALKYLKQAKYIIFVGIGSSSIIGKYGARYFSNVGWLSLYLEDPFVPIFQGNSEETTIVALSVSGETEQIVKMAESLKNRGCHVISITNTESCTLAKLSDCNISYHIPQIRVNERYDITFQSPALYILEILGRKLYRPLKVGL